MISSKNVVNYRALLEYYNLGLGFLYPKTFKKIKKGWFQIICTDNGKMYKKYNYAGRFRYNASIHVSWEFNVDG